MEKERIMKALKEKYNKIVEEYGSRNVFGIFLYGSQNYGMDTPVSDIDSKVIIVPRMKDIVNDYKVSSEHADSNGEKILYKDIRLVCKEVLKQNINSVEILYTDYCIINPLYKKEWKQIQKMRRDLAFYNCGKMLHSVFGTAEGIYHKLIKDEYMEVKEFVKNCTNYFRLNDFIVRYSTRTMDFDVCIKPSAADAYREMRMKPCYCVKQKLLHSVLEMRQSLCEYIDTVIASMPDANPQTKEKFERIIAHAIRKGSRAE